MIENFTLKGKSRRTKITSVFAFLFSLLALQSAGQQQIVFSQNYTGGSAPASSQCEAWNDFIAQLTPDKNYLSVEFKGSRNETGILLENSDAAASFANALHTDSNFEYAPGDQYWKTQFNGSMGNWLVASNIGSTFLNPNGCNSGADIFSLRACLMHGDWGGINGPTCSAESQRIDLVFTYGSIQDVENIPATCPESEDGSLTVMTTGGVAPYTFEWSNGVTTESGTAVDGLTLLGHFGDKSNYRSINQFATYDEANDAAGNFGALVKVESEEENAWLIANGVQAGDFIGGTDQDTEGNFFWSDGSTFNSGYTNWASSEPNNGGGTGQDYVQMYANGEWDDTDWNHSANTRAIFEYTATSKIENLSPGDYTVTVTDAEGTVTSATFTVGPDPIEVSFDMTQSSSCDETGDGALTANVSGGTAPYTYTWSSGETDASISDKAFGEYTVTVTDANDCASVDGTEFITVNDNVAPQALVRDIEVFLDANGAASILAEDIDNGSTDDCAIASMSVDVSDFTCADVSNGSSTFDGNTSLHFDGTDDYLLFNSVITQSPNHTIAAWIKTSTINRSVFGWGGAGVNNYAGVAFQGGNIRYYAGDGNPPMENVTGTTSVLDGNWHHVAVSRSNAGDVKIFVDGILDASGTVTKSVNSVTNSSVGAIFANGSFQLLFDGDIDEFTFWSEVLSEEEIAQMACTGPSNPDVFLKLNDGTGSSTAQDFSVNENHASLVNMDANAAWMEFGEPVENTQCSAGVKTRLTVTDAGGNISEANAYVMVRDTISPIVVSKTFTVELGGDGHGALTANNVDNGSTDNCEVDEMSIDKSSFSCEDLGTNQVTLSVTDIHGNSKSTAVEIAVVDNLEPTLSVQNVQVSLDAEGNASISTSDVEVSSADNCGIASKTLSLTAFSCEDLGGVVEVDMTVTDGSGNAHTETFEVTVIEEHAPVADPQAYTVALDENGLVEFDQAMIDEFIGGDDTDDCSGIDANSRTLNQTQFSCEDLGENTVTYSVSDLSGNTGTAPVVITIVDELAPTAIAQDIVAELDEDGLAVISAEEADNGSTDNCSVASRELNITEFTCENLGEQEVTMTVRDGSGNESEAVFTVTVVDNIDPLIPEELSMTLYLDENGEAIFDSSPLYAEASDACGIDAIGIHADGNGTLIEIDGTVIDCEAVGSSDGPMLVRDISGNQTGFTLNLNVQDTIKPSLDLNTIELMVDAEGVATLSEEILSQYAVDNCGVAEVSIQTAQFDCSQIGTPQSTEVTVLDLHGNSRQQTLEVVLIDAIAPELQVEDITLELDENGEAFLGVDQLDMIVVENCELMGFDLRQSAFNCADIGSGSQSITATDASGNSGIAQFVVNVVDNQSPEISGPEMIYACQGVPVNYDQIVATDNCSAQLNLIDGPQAGDMPGVGDFTVEFEAVDPSGNSTSRVIVLLVSPSPELDLGEDMVVAQGTEVTLTAGDDENSQYLWSDGSTENVLQFVATEDVIVSVEMWNEFRCSASDVINISVRGTLGIDEDANGNAVRFFPNPTRGQMSVALSLPEGDTDVRINIMDVSGQSVAQRLVPIAQDGDVISIDMSSFADGIYLVNLQSDSFNLTERVVKH